MIFFDWYYVRFNVDFNLEKLVDGVNVVVDDYNGIVNLVYFFIKKMNVKMNGVDVYDCLEVNQVINIKNFLEYFNGYLKSQGINEFFYIDKNRYVEERIVVVQVVIYNLGFVVRKLLLKVGVVVNVEILINWYGFFESFYDEFFLNF